MPFSKIVEINNPATTESLKRKASKGSSGGFKKLVKSGDLSLDRPGIVVFHDKSCSVIVRPPTQDEYKAFRRKCLREHKNFQVALVASQIVRWTLYVESMREIDEARAAHQPILEPPRFRGRVRFIPDPEQESDQSA